MELCLEMWRFCRPFLEKQFPCRVCALGTTWYGNCFSKNGVNGSFAPIEWLRKGSRNSDSTNKRRNFSTCFLSGEQHTPATGVNKCSNPDEGTLNEVSSLANEKFISSRNKYGAKGKAVLVSVLEARHCIQVCRAAHKINELVAQDNKLTNGGVYDKSARAKRKQHWWFNTNLALVSGSTNPRCGENHACPLLGVSKETSPNLRR